MKGWRQGNELPLLQNEDPGELRRIYITTLGTIDQG